VLQDRWEIPYFLARVLERPVCLIFQQSTFYNDYSARCRYESRKDGSDTCIGKYREEKLRDLKHTLKESTKRINKTIETCENELSIVSFNCCTLQTFNAEGQLIQRCLIDTAKIMFPYKGKD
jgi:hypothetical protein